MTHDQREIHRKKRILEYAERVGNINKTCRYFGVARSTFYLWRDRYRELGEEGLRSRRFDTKAQLESEVDASILCPLESFHVSFAHVFVEVGSGGNGKRRPGILQSLREVAPLRLRQR